MELAVALLGIGRLWMSEALKTGPRLQFALIFFAIGVLISACGSSATPTAIPNASVQAAVEVLLDEVETKNVAGAFTTTLRNIIARYKRVTNYRQRSR